MAKLTKNEIAINIRSNIKKGEFPYISRGCVHTFTIDNVDSLQDIKKITIKTDKGEKKNFDFVTLVNAYNNYYETGEYDTSNDKNGAKRFIKSLILDERICPHFIYINSYRVVNKSVKDKKTKKIIELKYILKAKTDKKGNETPIIFADSLETYYFNDIFKPSVSRNGKHVINKNIIKIDFEWCPLDLRKEIYKNGITVNGVKYVRYKRTASSSRKGTCLFIKKELFKQLDEWSNCIIDVKDRKKELMTNYSSFEAYKALTLSDAENFMFFNPKNILVIKDEKILINDNDEALVIRVAKKEDVKDCETYINADQKMECGDIVAFQDYVKIENKIWDGEGLLDKSVFDEEDNERYFLYHSDDKSPYEGHGMIFVRNRFFKSCLFNTNLQKYIKAVLDKKGISVDEKISNYPDILNGITLAERFSDIKMVVTHSSLKFLKFYTDEDPVKQEAKQKKAITDWMKMLSKDLSEEKLKGKTAFAITKTDKDTIYSGGEETRTSYQLINTLDVSEPDSLKSLLDEYLNDLCKAKKDFDDFEKLLKRVSGVEYKLSNLSYSLSPNQIKEIVVYKLLTHNHELFELDAFKKFADNYVNALIDKAKQGKFLIKGRLATLFGNPCEFLERTFKDSPIKLAEMEQRTIFCSGFEENKDILMSRSPHVMCGNIYVATNKQNEDIKEWFNLTKNIVCINSAKENVLCRLNGSDFDSDFVLITDNETLLDAAHKTGPDARFHYSKFVPPYNDIQQKDNEKKLINDEGEPIYEEIAVVDSKLANNNIGTIIDKSQLLNSIMWNEAHNDPENIYKAIWGYYFMSSILEVLSNIEIDAAKHEAVINSRNVLNEIDNKLSEITGNKYSRVLENSEKCSFKMPLFFKAAKGRENYKDKQDYYLLFENKAKKFNDKELSALYIKQGKIDKPIKYYYNDGKKGGYYKLPKKLESRVELNYAGKCLAEVYLKVNFKKKGDKTSRNIELVDKIPEGTKPITFKEYRNNFKQYDGDKYIHAYMLNINKDFSDYYYDYSTPMNEVYKYISCITNNESDETQERSLEKKKAIVQLFNREDEIYKKQKPSDDVIKFITDAMNQIKETSESEEILGLNKDLNTLFKKYEDTIDEHFMCDVLNVLVYGYKDSNVSISACGKTFSKLTNYHYFILYLLMMATDKANKDEKIYQSVFKK